MNTKASSSIDEKLDADFAEAWRPEPGDRLIGEVVSISERAAGYGAYPIVTVQPEEGEPLAIHAFRTVLASKLAEAGPKIGETVGVEYLGEVTTGDRPYHAYKVAVDRPEKGVDWSAYSEDVRQDGFKPAEPDAAAAFDQETAPVPADDDAPF